MNDKNRKRVVRRRLEEFASRTGFALGFFDELASTNDEARDARYTNGAVVIAEQQAADADNGAIHGAARKG